MPTNFSVKHQIRLLTIQCDKLKHEIDTAHAMTEAKKKLYENYQILLAGLRDAHAIQNKTVKFSARSAGQRRRHAKKDEEDASEE